MQEHRRQALLSLAKELGLTERRFWVKEWVKEPGIYRGRREGKLKYYWVDGETLHSGPFYSQEEALLFLEENLSTVCIR